MADRGLRVRVRSIAVHCHAGWCGQAKPVSANRKTHLINHAPAGIEQCELVRAGARHDERPGIGIAQIPAVEDQAMPRHGTGDRNAHPLAINRNVGVKREDAA
jgi:hypothetical protein